MYGVLGSVSPHGRRRQYARGHDDVTPVTQSFIDDRNGWGATVIDSLSTMVRMASTSLCTAVVNRPFPQYIMGLNVRGGVLFAPRDILN